MKKRTFKDAPNNELPLSIDEEALVAMAGGADHPPISDPSDGIGPANPIKEYVRREVFDGIFD